MIGVGVPSPEFNEIKDPKGSALAVVAGGGKVLVILSSAGQLKLRNTMCAIRPLSALQKLYLNG
jgi:hypothetical protein